MLYNIHRCGKFHTIITIEEGQMERKIISACGISA